MFKEIFTKKLLNETKYNWKKFGDTYILYDNEGKAAYNVVKQDDPYNSHSNIGYYYEVTTDEGTKVFRKLSDAKKYAQSKL